MPDQLAAHARRWKRISPDRPISFDGERVTSIDKAFRAACRRAEKLARTRGVLLDLSDVTPHTLKHTAVTWAFQNGMRLEDAVDYFATSARTLDEVYRQHSADHQERARRAMSRRR